MAGFEESSRATSASALIGQRSGSDAVKRNAGGKVLSQYGPLELPQCILPQVRRAAYRREKSTLYKSFGPSANLVSGLPTDVR